MRTEIGTIAAPSAAAGGGIGIIRLSGGLSHEIIKKIFKPAGKKSGKPVPFLLRYGTIIDPASGDIVDEVLVAVMPAGRSYTREKMAEIHCHGGPAAMRRALALTLACGARLAEPGEFTKRAFLSGRIDLSRAEAVADMVSATTEAGRRAAGALMGGALFNKISEIKEDLLNLLASVEASLDYPEDGITADAGRINNILGAVELLLKSADAGKIVREGIETVITGKPNAGKSSLFNALLGEERAIVTEIPGTTRDALTEGLNVRGALLKISDTAGIRETADIVENMGVRRTEGLIDRAELVLMVTDGSAPLDERDFYLFDRLRDIKTILVINKIDLGVHTDFDDLHKHTGKPAVRLSAKTGENMGALAETIEEMFLSGALEDGGILINMRHAEALGRAKRSLRAALDAQKNGLPDDLVAIDLTEALSCLMEVTGENAGDALVDRIFSTFCLGK